jgi:2-hydroxy-3-keto-5-methylthiopentenyl-1-phosphate phosphatase
MKIVCPLDSKDGVLPLINEGADIFYAGVTSDLLFNRSDVIVNCRSLRACNFTSFDELRESIDLIQ